MKVAKGTAVKPKDAKPGAAHEEKLTSTSYVQIADHADPNRPAVNPKGGINEGAKYKGEGAVPWDEAIYHQNEVKDCKTAACFQARIDQHVAVAHDYLYAGFANMHPVIQRTVSDNCAKFQYPKKAACMAVYAGNFFGSATAFDAALKAQPKSKPSEVLAGKFGNTLFARAVTSYCPGKSGNGLEQCLVDSASQLGYDTAAASHCFATAASEIGAVSVQSLLCEKGTEAVFPGDTPKGSQIPSNLGWSGLGQNVCHSEDLARSMLPKGPFPYVIDTALQPHAHEAPPQQVASAEEPKEHKPAPVAKVHSESTHAVSSTFVAERRLAVFAELAKVNGESFRRNAAMIETIHEVPRGEFTRRLFDKELFAGGAKNAEQILKALQLTDEQRKAALKRISGEMVGKENFEALRALESEGSLSSVTDAASGRRPTEALGEETKVADPTTASGAKAMDR